MREDAVHKVEVHVAGACIGNGLGPVKVLALHRQKDRALFPNLWECIGGQVKRGQTLEDAVLQHLREETGLSGTVLSPYITYSIRPDETNGVESVIPGVRFILRIYGYPEPNVDPRQHQNSLWLEEDELSKVEWIPGLEEQIRAGIEIYKKLHNEYSV